MLLVKRLTSKYFQNCIDDFKEDVEEIENMEQESKKTMFYRGVLISSLHENITKMSKISVGHYFDILIFLIMIIVSKVGTWATIYRNYRRAQWLASSHVYSFKKKKQTFTA